MQKCSSNDAKRIWENASCEAKKCVIRNIYLLSVENVGNYRLINNNGITLKGYAARFFLFVDQYQ